MVPIVAMALIFPAGVCCGSGEPEEYSNRHLASSFLLGSARDVAAAEEEDKICLLALSCINGFSENSKDGVHWT